MPEILSLSSPIIELMIAALLGIFLGIRREMRAQKSKEQRSFMGVRTMTILASMGAVSTFFPELPYLPLFFFTALIVFLGIAYANGSFHLGRIGLTSEFSAILTFWIGVLVGTGEHMLAITITVLLAFLNGFKTELHRFVSTLKKTEWVGALQLLILSGAILPFLPREPVDPWGVVVPFNVWLLIILISGIGFLGYFLIKYFGARGGIPLTGFFGAIVSSTAVTTSLSDQSKRSKMTGIFAVGILIALATMQVRVALEIIILGDWQIIQQLIVLPLAMAAGGALSAWYFFRHTSRKHTNLHSDVKLESPFEIAPALKFGLIFVLVLLALGIGQKYLGDSGVYLAAVLSGIIDIDAIVLSSLEAVKLGEMSHDVAANAITIALFLNTVIKIAYVAILGNKKLVGKITIGVMVTMVIGTVVVLLG